MRNITVNGRMAADVTQQVAKSGSTFISFSIANSEFGDPKNADGTTQTKWFRVTSFLPQHLNLAQHLKKGKPVIVTGRYSNRLYQSQTTGQWSISDEIIAHDISFELGGERNTTVATTQTNSGGVQVTQAVEAIPQATSRTLTSPKAPVAEVQTSISTDDLPF